MEYLVKNVDLEVEFHTNQIFLKKFIVRECMFFNSSPVRIEA